MTTVGLFANEHRNSTKNLAPRMLLACIFFLSVHITAFGEQSPNQAAAVQNAITLHNFLTNNPMNRMPPSCNRNGRRSNKHTPISRVWQKNGKPDGPIIAARAADGARRRSGIIITWKPPDGGDPCEALPEGRCHRCGCELTQPDDPCELGTCKTCGWRFDDGAPS